MKQAEWRCLFDDPDIRRWHQNLAGGSEGTAEEYIRILHRYAKTVGTTPSALVALAQRDRRAVEDQLSDFLTRAQKEGRAGGYTKNYPKVVRSWLAHHDLVLLRKFKIRGVNQTPTLDNERVPTQEELRSIFDSATLRGRAIISLMAYTGVRPEVLGNRRGTDGLRLRDLPDLRIEGSKPRFERVPAMIVVRESLSKTGQGYFTFLTREGCQMLQSYLEERASAGEALGSDSPVIRVTPGWEAKARQEGTDRSPFIVARNVVREVRDAFRPRFPWRPYVLRSYCDTRLMMAESVGKVPPSYRAFFLGRTGDMSARYTTHKKVLPADVAESMRRTYEASEPFLVTATLNANAEDQAKRIKLDLLRELAQSMGIDPLKVRIERAPAGENLDPEQEIRLLAQAMGQRFNPGGFPAGATFANGAGRRNRVVQGDRALEKHLNDGWEFVQGLPGGKFVVRRGS